VCICSLRHTACNVRAPCWHLWLAPLMHSLQYFSTFSHKRHDFRKFIGHNMCVLSFPTTFVCRILHSEKKWARYDKKCILVFIQSTLYSYPILMKLQFSRQIFEKYSNIKFHENPFCGSRDVACGQKSGEDEVVFLNFAKAPKIIEVLKYSNFCLHFTRTWNICRSSGGFL
jgi:hypothetical protein